MAGRRLLPTRCEEYRTLERFDALGLKLKKGGKSVLDGVTGELRHGRNRPAAWPGQIEKGAPRGAPFLFVPSGVSAAA